jgi:uncharacterized protein (UPF0332 family)
MVGDDFYSLAVTLSAGSTPAEHRSCISRAYYGAFHNANEFLHSIGITMKGGAECHQKVTQILDNSGDADIKTLASRLLTLRQTRNTADYNFANATFDKKPKAIVELRNAADIIAGIKKLRPTIGRTPIHEKIRAQAKIMGAIVV